MTDIADTLGSLVAAQTQALDQQLTEVDTKLPEPGHNILLAFQVELRRLIEQPLTNKTLHQIEHYAKTARGVISPAFGKRRGFNLYGGSIGMGDSAEDYGMETGAMSPSPPQETFGAKVIREIVGTLPTLLGTNTKKESLADLTFALEQARRMDDKALEEKLVRRINSLLDDGVDVPHDHGHADPAPALPAPAAAPPHQEST